MSSSSSEEECTPKKQKVQYRRQKYRKEWSNISPFKRWISEVQGNEFQAQCKYCNKILKAGKSELQRHESTESHRKVMRSLTFSSNLNNFVQRKFDKNEVEAEMRISLLVAEHNLSFNALQGVVQTFKSVFKDSRLSNKIKLGRTKCTNIINNVINPALSQELVLVINDKCFSVLVDECTDVANNKNLCILIEFKNKNSKVETQLFDLIQLQDSCNAATLYMEFSKCLERFNLTVSNIVGYCSDNANVMMGKN